MANRQGQPALLTTVIKTNFLGRFKQIFKNKKSLKRKNLAKSRITGFGHQAYVRADPNKHIKTLGPLCARSTLWRLLECRRSLQEMAWQKSFLLCTWDQETNPLVMP